MFGLHCSAVTVLVSWSLSRKNWGLCPGDSRSFSLSPDESSVTGGGVGVRDTTTGRSADRLTMLPLPCFQSSDFQSGGQIGVAVGSCRFKCPRSGGMLSRDLRSSGMWNRASRSTGI